jgi:hypothetical protein
VAVTSPRRSAGTKTLTDLLLHPAQAIRMLRGLPATDPTADLAAFAAGRPLTVAAHRYDGSRRLGGRLGGRLVLHNDAGPVMVWIRRRITSTDAGEEIRTPIEVEAVRAKPETDRWWADSDDFREMSFHAAGQSWTLAVPAIDVALVRTAISEANRRELPAPIATDPDASIA